MHLGGRPVSTEQLNKRCRICEVWKPYTKEFYDLATRIARCRECMNAQARLKRRGTVIDSNTRARNLLHLTEEINTAMLATALALRNGNA